MSCGEIAGLAPLYLSAELDAKRTAEFSAHLRLCGGCARELERQRDLDRRLRNVVAAEEVEATALAAEIRRRIAVETRSRMILRLAGAAAAICVILLAWYALRVRAVPRLLADAAVDHRREVVDRQPKKWRTGAAEIAELAQRQDIPIGGISVLSGYRLTRARLCRLDGRTFLHLVYADGVREVSVFLRNHDTAASRHVKVASVGGEQLASFGAGGIMAMCVAEESRVALSLARSAADVL